MLYQSSSKHPEVVLNVQNRLAKNLRQNVASLGGDKHDFKDSKKNDQKNGQLWHERHKSRMNNIMSGQGRVPSPYFKRNLGEGGGNISICSENVFQHGNPNYPIFMAGKSGIKNFGNPEVDLPETSQCLFNGW